MDKTEQAGFYVGAAIYKDLDSDEVDLILAAEGLNIETNSVKECKDAINRNLHPTPGGPIYDWEEIIARAKERGGL
jgi:hypothetical protein